MSTWNHRAFIDAVTNHRYTFACTAREFVGRFGELREATSEQVAEVTRLAMLCRDGIIRPR